MLLEYLEESTISVPETGETLVSTCGTPPHTIITSNAGNGGLVASPIVLMDEIIDCTFSIGRILD